MAHFAQLDDANTVIQVIVISNAAIGEPHLSFPNTEPVGQTFIANTLNLGWNWKQCSYNGTFRGAYPGPNWIYDPIQDIFIAHKEPVEHLVSDEE